MEIPVPILEVVREVPVPVGPGVGVLLDIGNGAVLPEIAGVFVRPVPVGTGPVPAGVACEVPFNVGYGAEVPETGRGVDPPVWRPEFVTVPAEPTVPVGPIEKELLESGNGGIVSVPGKPVDSTDPEAVAPVGFTDHVLLGKGKSAVLSETVLVVGNPVPLTAVVGETPVPVGLKIDVV